MSAPTLAGHLFLNRRQAAELCGVSVDLLDEAVNAGRLKAKKNGERNAKVLFRPADLEAWVESWEDK